MKTDPEVEAQTLGTPSPEDASTPRLEPQLSRGLGGRTAGLWTGDQVRARLRKYDRTPFIDLLALWMECAPNAETIELFAQRYPDRFIKALSDLGRMSGFADKTQVDVTLTAQVGALSDSQLEDRLRKAAERLGINVPEMKTLELEVIEEGS